MTPKNIYRSHTKIGLDEEPPTIPNGTWKKVPMPVFMAVTGTLFTIICSLVAWTWGSAAERSSLAAELATQFEKQAAVAVKAAETKFSDASSRMDRIQADMRELRDMVTRHIEMDKPGR